MLENVESAQLYHAYKPLLFSLAYRMLGSVADAEDIVQEAFIALYKPGFRHVQNQKAYLCKIVTNRCLELLRSARKQREVYIGTWLPEPLVASSDDDADPMQSYLQKESLSTAYLLLLQQLSYVERAVFLLRETMQYDYEEIADIVGKSVANCRQIFHRAKRSLATQAVSQREERLSEQHTANLVKQFIHALKSGDAAQMMKCLSTDAALYADGGGKVKVIPHPLRGHMRISTMVLKFFQQFLGTPSFQIARVNGLPGIIVYQDDSMMAVISISVREDRIDHLYCVVNPDKLKHVRPA